MLGDTFNYDFWQMFTTVKEDKVPWTKAKVGLLGKYHSEIVQSYWQVPFDQCCEKARHFTTSI